MGHKLKVLCARSMTAAVNALVGKALDIEADITFGTVGALQAKLAAGETADVLILGAPAIAKMEQSGALVAGTRKDIARTSIGVAVREGAPAPDISTAEAFKQALIGARAVAFSDAAVGGSAGVHLAALWGRIGLAEEIKRKAMPQKTRRRGRRARGRRQGRSRAHLDRRDRADQGCAGDREDPRAARQRHHLCRRHFRELDRAGGGRRLHRRARQPGRARRLDGGGLRVGRLSAHVP